MISAYIFKFPTPSFSSEGRAQAGVTTIICELLFENAFISYFVNLARRNNLNSNNKLTLTKINCIRPGLVDTPMMKEFAKSYPKDRFISENFVIAVASEILSSNLNGQIYNLDTNGHSLVS